MSFESGPFVDVMVLLLVIAFAPAGIFLVYGVYRKWSVIILGPVTLSIVAIGAVYWWTNHFKPFISGN